MAVQEKFDLVIRAQDEATATLRNVNREVERIGGTTVPKMTASMGGYTREMSRASVVTASMAGQVAGLHPKLSSMAGAFLFTSPAVAAVSIAFGILIRDISDMITEQDRYIETLKSSRSELALLAKSTETYAGIAKGLISDLDALNVKEKARLERLLSLANHGLREANMMERLGGSLRYVKLEGDEQRKTVSELTIALAKLNKEMAPTAAENLAEAFKATVGPMTSVAEIEEQLRRNVEATNEAWKQRIALMQGNALGGLADTTGAGFTLGLDQAEKEAQRLAEAFRESGAGPMSWIVDHEAAVQKATDQWREFSSVVMSSTDQLATGITDMFFGLRDSLADVFKSMAASWVRYFINEILKQTALKLGFALFNVIFPGSGGLLAGSGGLGAADIPVTPGLAKLTTGGSGLDIVSAGAKRFAGGGMSPASVNITIQGDVIGDEQYVNKRIIPAIENAIRYQKTIIASR